jgi:hypothetical protein
MSSNLFYQIQNILKNNSKLLSVKNYKNKKLYNYNKELISDRGDNISSDISICRSIITNNENKILMVSPSKSMKYEDFINKYPNINDVIVEKFIEGTMMNVFWDTEYETWEFSTKTNIGGNTTFFNEKTFRVLFEEVLEYAKFDVNQLDKNVCYSFVFQHYDNRIVSNFQENKLYLIEAYKIINDTIQILDTRTLLKTEAFNNTKVLCPTIYDYNRSYQELYEYYTNKTLSYTIMGVVIRDKSTNLRTKIRNPCYEMVRRLRGNNPKLQYHYYYLLKEDMISLFLTYYPEYTDEFVSFERKNILFNETLYKNYVSCYIKKEKQLNEYPKNYKTHMYNIHQIYKDILKSQRTSVDLNVVKKYTKKLDIKLYLWSVNFDYY